MMKMVVGYDGDDVTDGGDVTRHDNDNIRDGR